MAIFFFSLNKDVFYIVRITLKKKLMILRFSLSLSKIEWNFWSSYTLDMIIQAVHLKTNIWTNCKQKLLILKRVLPKFWQTILLNLNKIVHTISLTLYNVSIHVIFHILERNTLQMYGIHSAYLEPHSFHKEDLNL